MPPSRARKTLACHRLPEASFGSSPSSPRRTACVKVASDSARSSATWANKTASMPRKSSIRTAPSPRSASTCPVTCLPIARSERTRSPIACVFSARMREELSISASRELWSILTKSNPRRAAKPRMVSAKTWWRVGRLNPRLLMRRQQVVEWKPEAGHSGGHGRGEEHGGPTLEPLGGYQPEQDDESRADANQADQHVHERIGRKGYPEYRLRVHSTLLSLERPRRRRDASARMRCMAWVSRSE